MLNNVLSLETLQHRAPSIFSESSARRTSHKYQHISTIKVVEELMGKGFMPTWVTQSGCRSTDKKVYTKHTMRFRHKDGMPTASGLYPELVLVNSHDGLSSYRLMAGVYRVVCGNGLIAGNSYEEVQVRHQGDILGHVIEGTYQVIETANKMLKSASEMSAIALNDAEKNLFAEAAHAIRFEGNEEL